MDDLWVPPSAKVLPTERKQDGGSYFDDELQSKQEHSAQFITAAKELLKHVQQRPDHIVYVGTAEDRGKMRAVFNSWREHKLVAQVPTIKIDYGIPEGTIRIDEDRG
jgi:hypothetical protein